MAPSLLIYSVFIVTALIIVNCGSFITHVMCTFLDFPVKISDIANNVKTMRHYNQAKQ